MALLPALLVLLAAASQEPAPPPPAVAKPAPAAVAPAPETASYVRAREDENGVLVLEVGTRPFLPAGGKGPRIHLVSAVHIADAPFYAGAQERLDRFDLVLFEGVKPAGAGAIAADATPERRATATRGRLEILKAVAEREREARGAFPADLDALLLSAGSRRGSILKGLLTDGWGRPIRYERRAEPESIRLASDGPDGKPDAAGAAGDDLGLEAVATGKPPEPAKGGGLQEDLAAALGLAFQGDAMDPARPNWRCSDMSIDELQDRFAAAGADATELLTLLEGTSITARMARALLGIIGRAPKLAAMTKMIMVEALGSGGPEGMGGPPGMPVANMQAVMKVVIEERDGVVLADLRGVLANEPERKDVAVFYGAAHMPDLERRIVADLGYRPGEIAWTAAIRVDPKDAGYTPEQARQLRASLRGMLKKPAGGK